MSKFLHDNGGAKAITIHRVFSENGQAKNAGFSPFPTTFSKAFSSGMPKMIILVPKISFFFKNDFYPKKKKVLLF